MLKQLFALSSFVCLAFLLSFQVGVTSCTKTKTTQEQDTLLTTAILTANSWKIKEDRALVGSTFLYYLRGGTGNTINLDNEYMTFNANNTGIYHDNAGTETTFTWNFTDASNKKLIWLWNNTFVPGGPITVTWENINYDDGGIRYTEYYIQSGTHILGSIVRIPK